MMAEMPRRRTNDTPIAKTKDHTKLSRFVFSSFANRIKKAHAARRHGQKNAQPEAH
jgi:hypothetical protein